MKNLEIKSLTNRKWGEPYITVDAIPIGIGENYNISVRLEALNYDYAFYPTISVPFGKGMIVTKDFAIGLNGKKAKQMKMLACMIDKSNLEMAFKLFSETGYFFVSYDCNFYDIHQGIKTGEYGECNGCKTKMCKEILSDNKVRYICRAPYETEKDNLIFTVEWEKINE